jgi:ribosomal protein S18 acetylase RimI-like enzyme
MRDLLREYILWTQTLHPLDDIPAFAGIDEELRQLPGIYAPPQGRLLLTLVKGEPVGCVCLKPVADGVCELKRMYIKPSYRGMKIGQKLGEAFVVAASEIGYTKIILDSLRTMVAAHAIYRGLGFKVIKTPTDVPEFVQQNAIFMEMVLG